MSFYTLNRVKKIKKYFFFYLNTKHNFFNSSGTLSPQKERFVSGNSSMDSYSGMKIKQEAEEDPVVRVD